ncbi:DUF5615 family PIN-like protein [Prochlorothrix hollandica]|uniref:DUF5615 domain-containing protein n=1 Tax=Prochlorothrix hollandica PCC 9006 = CALU 1027 TaxID=317619 RepID=A0A0M2Q1Q1_PROHO|nr:DUF5615 family PIN-like protein [Prochlorothrix hollandica]KKJ01233.1 hypothetical protein PROH_02320 [Prochlorothrix hollandica PCC 9006 = CALU 1027]
MAIGLYMDVHVPQAITDQLRRRGVDVLTAWDDGMQELPDDQLLDRVTDLGRILFTQDIRFRVLAERWQSQGRNFSGLVFGHQLGGTIGQFVQDLECIAQASDPEEWLNGVDYIPFKRL